eukprot:2667511-Pyramimonas_sp.AAC.1
MSPKGGLTAPSLEGECGLDSKRRWGVPRVDAGASWGKALTAAVGRNNIQPERACGSDKQVE